MKVLAQILTLLIVFHFTPNQDEQKEKVSIQIIDKNGETSKVTFDWPFDGPPSIGSSGALIEKVDEILKDNEIDCPPKREKVTDTIWLCGNGKKIKTDDKKLKRLLALVWDKEEE